jgi:hypothetical protein
MVSLQLFIVVCCVVVAALLSLSVNAQQCITEKSCPMTTYNLIPLYRYYSDAGIDHFYTVFKGPVAGYRQEMISGYCSATQIPGTTPLYRYYSDVSTDHLYNIDYKELQQGAQTYRLEGTECYVFTYPNQETTPFYRYYKKANGNAADSLYTTYFPELGLGKGGYILQEAYAGHLVMKDTVTIPTCSDVQNCAGGAPATFSFSADNTFTLYKNREKKMAGADWRSLQQATFKINPGDIIVAQIFNVGHGHDGEYHRETKENPAALLGRIEFLGRTINTNAQWKCIEGWRWGEDLDSWPAAGEYGDTYNGALDWSTGAPIRDQNVKFIYASSVQFLAGGKATCAIRIPQFCSAPKSLWNGNACQCPNSCSFGQTTDNNCNCVCPSGQSLVRNINGDARCAGGCPANKMWNSAWTGCICLNQCSGGRELTDSCSCVCNAPRSQWDGSSCQCPSGCPYGQSQDYSCNCACPAGSQLITNQAGETRCAPACPVNKVWTNDWSSCICTNQCSGGGQLNDNCDCVCNGAKSRWDGGSCQCPESCPYGQNQDESCGCACPVDQQLFKNSNQDVRCARTCPPNKVWNNEWTGCTCLNQCPASQSQDDSCGCACPSEAPYLVDVNGESKCMAQNAAEQPEGAVPVLQGPEVETPAPANPEPATPETPQEPETNPEVETPAPANPEPATPETLQEPETNPETPKDPEAPKNPTEQPANPETPQGPETNPETPKEPETNQGETASQPPKAEQTTPATGVPVQEDPNGNPNQIGQEKAPNVKSKKNLNWLIALGSALGGTAVLAIVTVVVIAGIVTFMLVGKSEFYSIYDVRQKIQSHFQNDQSRPLLQDLEKASVDDFDF